jgi:preprotein translocase subunit SecY
MEEKECPSTEKRGLSVEMKHVNTFGRAAWTGHWHYEHHVLKWPTTLFFSVLGGPKKRVSIFGLLMLAIIIIIIIIITIFFLGKKKSVPVRKKRGLSVEMKHVNMFGRAAWTGHWAL